MKEGIIHERRKRGHMQRIVLTLGVILSIVLLGFYAVVLRGKLNPHFQVIWVTTAMTTTDHHWLATRFIPKKEIEKIMEENKVEDEGYTTYEQEEEEKKDKVKGKGKGKGKGRDTGNIVELERPTEKYRTEKEKQEAAGYIEKEPGIYIKEVTGVGWRGKLMLVTDPKRVMLIDTPTQYEKGWTVAKMVEKEAGVAGVNGGGFLDGENYNSNGGIPAGLLVVKGKIISPKGEGTRKYKVIGLKEGKLTLGYRSLEEVREKEYESAVEFGPFLVVNGEGVIKKGTGGYGLAPRTAIGQKATGELIFLVIDGRQPLWSIGVDLKPIQEIYQKEGCINAAMLDGGSSTVMYYKGGYENRPSLGHERYINNCYVVKKKKE